MAAKAKAKVPPKEMPMAGRMGMMGGGKLPPKAMPKAMPQHEMPGGEMMAGAYHPSAPPAKSKARGKRK